MCVAAFVLPRRAFAQTDVIRGRIVGPDSQPVERATITVTSLSGNITRSTRTDKAGRYTVPFPSDEGDYYVSVAAIGFATKRFEIKRTADQEILIGDARLQRVAAQLDAMTVRAQRQKPGRDDFRPDIGGSERPINSGGVPVDQLGDLAALAASLPGVQLIPSADGGPNGFSVLGLSPDQNATTLNGLNFNGSNIPRDANVSTSLVTSPYDVSRGNFSGGLLQMRTGRASNFIIRTSSASLDAPQLQWTDPAARSLGQQYTNVTASGLFSGPISTNKAFFNVAYQIGRRQSDLQSLLNTSALGLQTAGVARDSVNRLLSILSQAGVPTRPGGVPNDRATNQALLLGSFDFTPPGSTTGQAFNLTYNASLLSSDAVTGSTTELPSHSGDRTSWNAGVSGRHTSYFGFGILSETSLGLSANRSYGSPYLELPNGSVLVNSIFADGTSGVQPLSFGGNPSMGTSVTTQTAQGSNQLSWFSENNKHRIKLTSELRRDAYGQDLTTNRLGTFSFNSLADLESGTPASFTRELSPRRRSESEYIGGLSLGDSYTPTSDFQLQYGVRLDGNRFNIAPVLNPDVEQTLGIRNDHAPNNVYASPRVGFSWTYGTAQQVGGFEGAVRGPRAVVRGGIGVFQSTPSAALIGSALDNTGLPSGVQQLTCVGAAAPTPDWAAYLANQGAIPTACADGTTGTTFSSAAPNVAMFDPGYAAPRALRSNLNWAGTALGRFALSAEMTYSLNMNQASTFDLNFDPTARFALSDEGNRPVYASASGIVPSTGTVSASQARLTPDFTHVSELRSDMRSETRQLSLSLSPTSFSSSFMWRVGYVYGNNRERYRGFTSTAGDPTAVDWSRGSFDSRHQIVYSFTYNAFDWVRIGWNGSFRSGNPYTPMVASDINGDGYANDRAYVFDPSKTNDPALAAGMRELLASGSSSARDCLRSQLGQLAARNSCQGPWMTSANMSFQFNPLKVRMPQRANLSFQISNPLGAADIVMHGENHLHGWGQPALPSSQLLFVRGFDPATQRYQYEVNQRFGATSVAQTATRLPVTLTALLRVDVGPSFERQMLTRMLDQGRRTPGQKAPEVMLKAYSSFGLPNPMAVILRQADTLQLTSQQADSVAVLNRWFTIKLDSIWSPVAKFLAQLPDDYNEDVAYDRYRSAREASVDALMRIAPDITHLLTPEQVRKLPSYVSPMLDHRYLASIRSGSMGGGLGMVMLPGGGSAVSMDMGGGGARVQVIMKSGSPE